MPGGSSGAGDGDEGDGVGSDPVPMALECHEVMVVELARLQPLDRAKEQQLPGHWFPVGADNVDLDVVAARPVTADYLRGRNVLGGQQARERCADQRLDGTATPVSPAQLGLTGSTHRPPAFSEGWRVIARDRAKQRTMGIRERAARLSESDGP